MSLDLGLRGKVAIVTGGSVGIGKETARKFAEEGVRVVIASRTAKTLEEAAEQLRAATGGTVRAFPTDTTKRESVATLVATTVAEFGSVDILVNCAAAPAASCATISRKPTRMLFSRISIPNWSAISGCARRAFRTCGRPGGGASSTSGD